MRTLLLLCLFLIPSLCTRNAYANWQRPVTNYTRHDYKAGTQNWMLEQQDNGWIYVANNKGLLEFDGEGWNLYPIHDAKMKAVRKGRDGRIYVGGISQFGFFEPDGLGGLQYTSLSDSLTDLNVGVVRTIWVASDQVYFQADRYVFCWGQGRLTAIDCRNEIAASGLLNQKLYVVSSGGLAVLNGSTLMPIAGTEALAAGKVVRMLPYKDSILMVTRRNGLYLYHRATGLRALSTAADAFIRRNEAFCAELQGELLAVGTIQGGVCLLDMEQGRMEVISISDGLQNKTVLGMMFDADSNLWLGLDNGIDCVQLRSRLFLLYGGRSLVGSGYVSAVYRGRLYLGTNQGIYCTRLPGFDGQDLPMDFVEATGGQVWDLLPYDGRLFCSIDNGVFVVDGERTERLPGLRGVRCIIALPGHPDALVAGTYGVNRGLYLIKKRQGRWGVEGKIAGYEISCKSLLADGRRNCVWVANQGEGIHCLRLSDDLRQVEEEKAYGADGLFDDRYFCLTYLNDDLMVASRYGLWRYDAAEDSLKRCHEWEAVLGHKGPYTYLAADSLHNIWYSDGEALRLVRYDAHRNTYHKDRNDVYLPGSMIEYFEHVSMWGNYSIIASEGGFALLDRTQHPEKRSGSTTLQIRKVYLTAGVGDSLVYGRSYRANDTLLTIPYRCNSLRIEYCANDYARPRSAMYSYRLSRAGSEGTWSEYSRKSMKEFTELAEGKYEFSVRLLAEEGDTPLVTSFSFRVLPPWYRTWWSCLAYVAIIGLLLYYVYHRVADRHKRLLMQKELELLRQQQEFEKESELKDEKIDSLEKENLQAELRHKSEELVRTTLNIVRKNEMLLGIKKEVLGISHSISEENLVAIRRKTLRLLGQIDTNIEHDDDLQAFQGTFDSVHHDFFRKIEEAYPELSHKEKLLCAYIQMNLLSKEIAPLMNISVRGVEISRYRLRKKLGLEEGENLTEFLQRFSK